MIPQPSNSIERGFTMIEAIIVIVITGILAAMVSVFIARPVQGYADTTRRALLADASDIALRRMVREVRLALPNSLRLTTIGATTYIEFIPTLTGGRYRDYGDGSSAGNFLDFSNALSKTFDVLGPLANSVAANDYVVVYNLGEGYSPADAYRQATGTNINIAQINAIAGTTVSSITLNTNVFAQESPPLPSPNSRFQIVQGVVRAVTYGCPTITPGNLVRYWNYGFNPSFAVPSGGQSAVVAQNAICTFDYQNAVQRTALLSIQLTVSDAGTSGEKITVFQQIHVDNSP